MRKLASWAVALMAVAVTAACTGGAGQGKVKLATGNDSLSYAVGMTVAQEYKSTVSLPHVTDTLLLDDFLKGVEEGTAIDGNMKEIARVAGLESVFQLSDAVKNINRICYGGDKQGGVTLGAMADAYMTVIKGENPGMTGDEAYAYLYDEHRADNPMKLARATGISMGDAVLQNDALLQKLGVDAVHVGDYLNGMNEGLRAFTNEQAKAAAAGIVAGRFITSQRLPFYDSKFSGNDSTRIINASVALTAFRHAMGSVRLQLIKKEAEQCMERHTLALVTGQFADNKTAGQQFLAANKTKDGVQTTASGLQYKVLKQGDGPVPTATDVVKVHYEGRLIDGTVFDSSLERGEPMLLPLNELIDGWAEALQMMPVGSEWELYIPQELAYGSESIGEHVKPFSTLIYRVQLLEIKAPKKPAK